MIAIQWHNDPDCGHIAMENITKEIMVNGISRDGIHSTRENMFNFMFYPLISLRRGFHMNRFTRPTEIRTLDVQDIT